MTMKDERLQHPSYGFIKLSRTQGGNGLLFMSPLRHDNRITIVVGEAEQVRSNNYDTYYPRRHLVEVDMSEGQFAQFICNAYSSQGAPCTIRRSESGPRQPIEVPQLKSERYRDEAKATAQAAIDELQQLKAKLHILTAKLPQKSRDEIDRAVDSTTMKLSDRLPWIVQMIHEHMDKVVDAAKVEIEQYIARSAVMGLKEVDNVPMLPSGEGST
ncbi:MAG: hypothetical protein E6Q97_28120 [Desulfurellales bacterium]|nr:MAG: hypothetical protein E6Q97_28120 [Desulfurellales bacterium]